MKRVSNTTIDDGSRGCPPRRRARVERNPSQKDVTLVLLFDSLLWGKTKRRDISP